MWLPTVTAANLTGTGLKLVGSAWRISDFASPQPRQQVAAREASVVGMLFGFTMLLDNAWLALQKAPALVKNPRVMELAKLGSGITKVLPKKFQPIVPLAIQFIPNLIAVNIAEKLSRQLFPVAETLKHPPVQQSKAPQAQHPSLSLLKFNPLLLPMHVPHIFQMHPNFGVNPYANKGASVQALSNRAGFR